MVCTIQAQIQRPRASSERCLQLALSQPHRGVPFWRCEFHGNDEVEIVCGQHRQRVSSRTALKLLMRELMLRDGLSDLPIGAGV